jgi:hypothetical protein
MLRRLIALTLFLIPLGCASIGRNRAAVVVEEIDWPIAEIRTVIGQVLPVGVRAMSPNGHEILSRHFVLDRQGRPVPANDAIKRYYTQILILGDRRPYNIEILVTQEERALRGNQFTYVISGYDTRLAKQLESRLRSELTKRREDRNIIDDFRVY